MSGPPVALFMSNQNTKKEAFRANITIYVIVLNCFNLVNFFVSGLLTGHVLANSVWLIPSMIIGVAIGNIAVTRISQPVFRKIALVLIFSSGFEVASRRTYGKEADVRNPLVDSVIRSMTCGPCHPETLAAANVEQASAPTWVRSQSLQVPVAGSFPSASGNFSRW